MSDINRHDTLREITNEAAAALPGWQDPYFVQAFAIVARTVVNPWGPEIAMPNGETAKPGMVIVSDPDTSAARYCLPYVEFMDGYDSVGDGLYQPKPLPTPMLLLNAPFCLHAPDEWTGHKPWVVADPITLPFRGAVLTGYPVLKTPQGQCHADPSLWQPGHYQVTGTPTGQRP